MNIDPFTKQSIHDHGFWMATDCLSRERSITDTIESLVEGHGYVKNENNHRLWIKGTHKIIICLVDDIRSAGSDYETDMPYLFDSDTLIITDNYVSCPTMYSVLALPHSFFGIYHHDCEPIWRPDRSFSFSVNRIDDRRFKLMLELGKRVDLSLGYVNFNCQDHGGSIDPQHLQDRFRAGFANLYPADVDKYQQTFERLWPLMPLKNYEIDHEHMHTRSRCNMIVESFGSDTSVAFSEKIFRALQLPVPWTVYGGHYAVARLESLGFDCMSDVINHNHYDQLKEIEDKARIYIWFSLKFARESSTMDQRSLIDRCELAAQHNRDLLRRYVGCWDRDFQQWQAELGRRLSSSV